MAEDFCTNEKIKNAADKCLFASEFCKTSFINFYTLHYCNFEEHLYFSIPFWILLLVLCFYLISSTSNKYLSSALTTFADKLGLNEI